MSGTLRQISGTIGGVNRRRKAPAVRPTMSPAWARASAARLASITRACPSPAARGPSSFSRGRGAGVGFVLDAGDTAAGRRVAIHEYPYRDDAWAEDLGKLPRRFSIQAFRDRR